MMLRRKLIDDASGKYFAGHEISPIRNPKNIAWASISLSNTKSSEFSVSGSVASTLLENARYPV